MRRSFLSGFYFDLLQDVNILRPLVYMVCDDFGMIPTLVISGDFLKRDSNSIWISEINEIAEETNSKILYETSRFKIWSYNLRFSSGFMISASESNLRPPRNSHNLFKTIPSRIKKITLQHGYECVGFLMNKQHQDHFGTCVSFNADIIGGWLPIKDQKNLRPSQSSKYIHLGCTAHIESTSKRNLRIEEDSLSLNHKECGIICENLHSIRHQSIYKDSFLDQVHNLARMANEIGEKIALRPHPGGQYILKKKTSLPDNVFIDNRPAYKIDWKKYRYGISAPSSVIVDFLYNEIPCILWQDPSLSIDTSSFDFLPIAQTEHQLFQFIRSSNDFQINLNLPLKSFLLDSANTYKRYYLFLKNLYFNHF